MHTRYHVVIRWADDHGECDIVHEADSLADLETILAKRPEGYVLRDVRLAPIAAPETEPATPAAAGVRAEMKSIAERVQSFASRDTDAFAEAWTGMLDAWTALIVARSGGDARETERLAFRAGQAISELAVALNEVRRIIHSDLVLRRAGLLSGKPIANRPDVCRVAALIEHAREAPR